MILKQLLKNKTPILGTFIKTPHYHVIEVLSHSELDVFCLDAEHAPFSRSDLDRCILAGNAASKPILVRLPNDSPHEILNALDLGATGIVVPHVKTATQATTIVNSCFFGDGGRGYAGSTRFAKYTTSSLSDNLSRNSSTTCIIAQIEDLVALDELDEICKVEGIDCIFIGTMDLTVALRADSSKAEKVRSVINHIVSVAKSHNKTIGMFVADLSELSHWQSLGVSVFLLQSDHGFMLSGARTLKNTFDSAIKN